VSKPTVPLMMLRPESGAAAENLRDA